jgi:hypothetical protein
MNVINRDKSIKGFYPAADASYISFSDSADNVPDSHNDGLFIGDGATSTMKVTFADDSVYTFASGEMTNGMFLDISVKRVWATGTSVTKVKGYKREP